MLLSDCWMMCGYSLAFAGITKHYGDSCAGGRLRSGWRAPSPKRSTSNCYERKNDSRTHGQSPVSRGLELRKKHQLLQPLIDAGRSLTCNDLVFVNLANGVQLRLHG